MNTHHTHTYPRNTLTTHTTHNARGCRAHKPHPHVHRPSRAHTYLHHHAHHTATRLTCRTHRHSLCTTRVHCPSDPLTSTSHSSTCTAHGHPCTHSPHPQRSAPPICTTPTLVQTPSCLLLPPWSKTPSPPFSSVSLRLSAAQFPSCRPNHLPQSVHPKDP